MQHVVRENMVLLELPRRRFGLLMLAILAMAQAISDGLASTPPMGYNSWNDLECKPDEVKLRKIAVKLKSTGLLDLGYQYLTVDDCWMAGARDEKGQLTGDKKAFPSGMKEVANYIHSLGFKFGLYTSRGVGTCVGLPSSMGHEETDAKTFASWGVDFLKNDGCWDPDCGAKQPQYPGSGTCDMDGRRKALSKYVRMREALNRTGRPIVQAICGWEPWYAPAGRSAGQMWRIGADVRDWAGVYETTRVMEQLTQFSGPNGWNDPDMLLGSSQGAHLSLTPKQARAQFSLWVVMAAPLILGANVLQMSDFDLETYGNREAIQVNQDRLGYAGKVVFSNCPAYPTLITGLSADGTPFFKVNTSGVEEDGVSCGSHAAADCKSCPRGHGSSWCNGDCRWEGDSHKGKCVLHLKQQAKKLPVEDSPDPWRRPAFREVDKRQCQQAWLKTLHTGEVALAVVNFASTVANVNLSLVSIGLPWNESKAVVQDLWSKDSSNRSIVVDALQLRLDPDGGHALLKLARPRLELIQLSKVLANQPSGEQDKTNRTALLMNHRRVPVLSLSPS